MFSPTARSRFTSEALAQVLAVDLALTPDVPLYVAYSGGMDSHVLLQALAHMHDAVAWNISALHIDHALQARSSEWAQHCADVCSALKIPFHSERIAVSGIDDHGLEDAARRARYAALARLLPANAVLLTAHHQDDQAETLLLQLLRGAGVPGLAAMPAVASFAGGRLMRPLLGFARAALAEYAAAQELHWVDDASNADERLTRNFLRHRVLPMLTARWPQARETLTRAARHQAHAARLLEEVARADLAQAADAEGGGLTISRLQSFSVERQTNLVRYWIGQHGVRMPSEAVLQQIQAQLSRCPQTGQALVRWAGAEVRRYRDRLVLLSAQLPAPADWEAEWDSAQVLAIPGSNWQLRAESVTGAGVSRARITGKRLQIRLRRGGERCLLRGHHHKVKKMLQEAGVPPWERARLPLLFIDGNLAAVGDRWVCEPYAASADEPGIKLVLEPAP